MESVESGKTMIHDQDLPMHLWVEAARRTVYVQNRLSHSASMKKYMNMYLPEMQKLHPPLNETSEDHDMLEPQDPPTMNISRKRKPAWVREIIQEVERYGAPEGSIRSSKRSKPYSSYVALMCDLVDQEPTTYEEVPQRKNGLKQ